MEAQEVRIAIEEFIHLLEEGQNDKQANAHALEICLNRLALAYHYADAELDCETDAPSENYDRLRQLAGTRFPGFGYYNEPVSLTKQLGTSGLMAGDALDDIADIARDLYEVLWYWNNHCEGTALWQFRWGYENHWGAHLRSLQRYLYELLYR